MKGFIYLTAFQAVLATTWAQEGLEIRQAVELEIQTVPGEEYFLQFSTDGENWTTESIWIGAEDSQYAMRSIREADRRFWRLCPKGQPPEARPDLDLDGLVITDPLGTASFSFDPNLYISDPDGGTLSFDFRQASKPFNSPQNDFFLSYDSTTNQLGFSSPFGPPSPGNYPVLVTASDKDGSASIMLDVAFQPQEDRDHWVRAWSVFEHWQDRLAEFPEANGLTLRVLEDGTPTICFHVPDDGIGVPPFLEFDGASVPTSKDIQRATHVVSLDPGDDITGDPRVSGTLGYPFQRLEDGVTVLLTNLHVAGARYILDNQLEDFSTDVLGSPGVPIFAGTLPGDPRIGIVDAYNVEWWDNLTALAAGQPPPPLPIHDAATVALSEDHTVNYELPANSILPSSSRYPSGPVYGWDFSDPLVAAMIKQQRRVIKFGAATGATRNLIQGVGRALVEIQVGGVTQTINYPRVIIAQDLNAAGSLVAEGDSGSVVFFEDTLQPCGLLFAANSLELAGGTARTYYMLPLQPILADLQLRFAPPRPSTISRRYQYFTCPLSRSTCVEEQMFRRADTSWNSQDPLAPFNRSISSSSSGAFLIADNPAVTGITVSISDELGNSVSFDQSSHFVKAPGTHKVGCHPNSCRTIDNPQKDSWAAVLDWSWLGGQGLRVEPGAPHWFVTLTVTGTGRDDVLNTKLRVSN